VANTITLSVEWTDLYRINIKWNKAKADTLEPFTYRLTQTDVQGNKTTKDFTNVNIDTNYTAGEPDSLLQGTRYWYKVEGFNKENKLKDTSKTIEAKTLSPTSHDIVWRIDTLGQPGNFLYDVWGLNENCVYAVGGVTLPEGRSGVIKWDGEKWNPLPSFEGTKVGIFGFAENDFWVVTGDTYGKAAHWNGSVWEEYSFYPPPVDTVWGLRSVWGSSPSDVWAVGDFGTIIHWDGVEWRKVNAGITTPITDVWGTFANETYLICYDNITTGTSAIYKYDGSVWQKMSTIGVFNYGGSTVWKSPGGKLLAGGRSLLEFAGNSYQEIFIKGKTRGIVKIRGSNINNIFTAGTFGEITHFDGLNWKDIEDFEVPNGRYRILYSVWCSEHKVLIVGVDENRAIIINGTINH
jgi:hypothetical protein